MRFLGIALGFFLIASQAIAQSPSMGNSGSDDMTLSAGGSEHMRILSTGNVGIGTTSPTITLDIAGAIKIANDATACTAGVAGAIRYNAGTVEYCNGTAWGSISAGALPSGTNGQTLQHDGSNWVASTVNQSANTMVASWPDVIMCSSGAGVTIPFYLSYSNTATTHLYEAITTAKADRTYIQYTTATGAYSSNVDASSHDCVTNSWSIAQLYSNGRAFNFVGGNGSDISLTMLADVSATTPTDGQVLTWDDSVKSWKPADSSGGSGSGTASTMLTGWPDAIQCTNGGNDYYYYLHQKNSSNQVLYLIPDPGAYYNVTFDSTGAFVSTNLGTACSGKSIATLKSENKAFNFIGSNGASGSVVAGWPDAIRCHRSDYNGDMTLYNDLSQTNGDIRYSNVYDGVSFFLQFSSNGNFATHNNMDATCINKTIATLYSENRAFNFVGGSGAGATAVAGLTDVSNTTPTDGQVLSWNDSVKSWQPSAAASGLPSGTNGQLLQHDGSNWVATSNSQSASTMIAGWPDAIVCNTTNPSWGATVYYKSLLNQYITPHNQYAMVDFNNDGSYNNDYYNGVWGALVTTDCAKSISQLYTDGQAYNLVGGNGGDISLTTLADVSASAVTDGQILAWNNANSAWEPTAQSAAEIGTLTSGKWCSSDGTTINCTNDEPVSASSVAVSQAAGSTIGNMTGGGNLAAGFDGNTSQASHLGPTSTVSPGYIGKDWGASNDRRISKVEVHRPNNAGFDNAVAGETITFTLQGSADNSAWTDLGSSTHTDTDGAGSHVQTVTSSSSTLYRYHRVQIATTGNPGLRVAEVVFYEIASGGGSNLPSGTNGQLLQHDGSNWVATSNNQSASSMVAGWPDAIVCTNSQSEPWIYLISGENDTEETLSYYLNGTNTIYTKFNVDGSYNSSGGYVPTDCTKSIAQHYTDGQAFNFVGGNGSDISLTTLADVSATAPTDGQVLAWSNTNSRWEAAAAASGLPSGTNGQILQHDGSNWVSVAAANVVTSTSMFTGFPDVLTCTSASNVTVVMHYNYRNTSNIYYRNAYPSVLLEVAYDLSGNYSTHTGMTGYDCVDSSKSIATLYSEGNAFNLVGGNGVDTSLTMLADVSATAPTDGQVLAWSNANSRWEAAAAPSSLPSGTNGQILQHDGSNWISVAATNGVSTSTMLTGWPDAITCNDGSGDIILQFHYKGNADKAYYKTFTNGEIQFNDNGTYNQHSNLAGYDCVTNAKSIATLYSEGNAFNYVGGNGVDTSLTALADVSATAPTDGQVLAWSNANSRWEAAAAASGLPSGTNGQTLQHDGSNWIATSNNQSANTMVAGFPDAIQCEYTNGFLWTYALNYVDPATGNVLYRWTPGNASNIYDISFNSSGNYLSHQNSASHDCVTSSKSIATLYTEGRAFNFVGGNGVDTSLTMLADVSATAPTDGQVLAWSNANTRWEPTAQTAAEIGTLTSGKWCSSDGSVINCTDDAPSGGGGVGEKYTLTAHAGSPPAAWTDGNATGSTIGSFLTNYDWDLGSSKEIDIIKVYGATTRGTNTNGGAGNMTIFGSNDASAWTNLGQDTAVAMNVNGLTFTIDTSGSYRYIRLDGNNVTGDSDMFLAEFEVYGPAGPTLIGSLDDVSSTVATDGQVLTWDDSVKSWKPATAAGGGSSTASAMVDGWPDAIKCTNGNLSRILHMYHYDAGTSGHYKVVNASPEFILNYDGSGNYTSHSNLSGFDCVTGSKSISTLYSDSQAYNFVGSNGAGSSMISGWPDSLTCTVTNPAWNTQLQFMLISANGSGAQYRVPDPTTGYNINFAGDGSFSSYNNLTTTDCGKSISQLYADGQAHNFIGGNGAGATTIAGLTDVSSTTPTDGQVLSWNDSVKSWQPAAAASGLPSGTNSQTLQHDGSNWVAVSNNQTANSGHAGWPDMITCSDGTHDVSLFTTFAKHSSGTTFYNGVHASHTLQLGFTTATKAYASSNFAIGSGYDCVTNTWSIDDLYTQGKAFNLVGGQALVNDADNDTKVHVEKNTDEDIIRFDTAGAERMIIDASGNVAIGIASASYKLHVNGAAAGTSWQNLSDRRHKKDINSIENVIDRFMRLEGVQYEWKEPKDNTMSGTKLGVIAQDVEAVFPEAVSTDNNGTKRVDYNALIAPMIEVIKTQQQQIDDLQKQINELKK